MPKRSFRQGLALTFGGLGSMEEQRKRELDQEVMELISQHRLGQGLPGGGVTGTTPPLSGLDFSKMQTEQAKPQVAPQSIQRHEFESRFGPGTEEYQTKPGQEYYRSKTLGQADIAKPESVYKALVDAGMEKEAASYAQRVGGATAGGKSVWELRGDVGGADLSQANIALLDDYQKSGAITKSEADAMKVINKRRPYDVSDWLKALPQARGKAFAEIPGAVEKEKALLEPRKATAKGTAGASAVGRILAEHGLADVSAETAAIKARAVEEEKRVSTLKKATGKATVQWAKVQNLMKNIWERKKEQLGVTGAGLVAGGIKIGLGKLRLPGGEKTATYEGQKTETAMALNSILTGQNRLIEGIFHRIVATLPTELDPKSYSIPKIDQSLRNSYGLVKAMRMNGLLDEEYLKEHEVEIGIDPATGETIMGVDDEYEKEAAKLTPEPLNSAEEKEVREVINGVLGSDSPYLTQKTGIGEGKPPGMTEEEWNRMQELLQKEREGTLR